MAVKPQPQKPRASDPEYQIKALEEGIVRADKNIVIFSQEVENQKALKKQLQEELARLKEQKGK
jgi:phage shock protein A